MTPRDVTQEEIDVYRETLSDPTDFDEFCQAIVEGRVNADNFAELAKQFDGF